MSAFPPDKNIKELASGDYDYEIDCEKGMIKRLKPEVQLTPIELDERIQAFIDKDWAGDLPAMLDELIDIVKESES